MTAFRITVLTIVIFIMLALTGVNLLFSNTLGETCGIIHPYIFETQVSIVDPVTGRDWDSVAPIPSSADEQLDTYLRLYDADGKILEQNDDYESGNSGIIDFKVSTPKTVTIEAATFNDVSQGHYKLQVEDTPADLSGVFQEISVGASIEGEIKANSRNYYLLPLTANAPINIMLNGQATDGSELDTQLRVYNEARQMINQNDDYQGLGSGITDFSVGDDSTVVLEIGTYNDSEEGSYTLNVTPYVAGQEESQSNAQTTDINSDPNIEIVDAGLINVGDTVTNNIAVDTRLMYSLDLKAEQYVDIYITGDLDSYLRIYDETGRLIAENDDSNDSSNAGLLAFGLPMDSTVSVVVGTYTDSYEGDFGLVVEDSSLQVVKGDSIAIDESLNAELALSSRNRHTLSLEAGQKVNINLDSEIDTYLRLYDSSGRLLRENDDLYDMNAGITNFGIEGGGTIIIEVGSYGDSDSGEYQLSVSESHLQFIDGGALTVGNPTSGELSPDNRVRYNLELFEGQAISFNLTGQDAQGEPLHSYMWIYDESGELLYESYNWDDSEKDAVIPRFDSPASMNIIVEVGTVNDIGAGTYQLDVEDFQVTTIVGEDAHVGSRIDGSLDIGQRIQHALHLEANQPLIILLESDMDSYLRIYDENGNLLTENDNFVGTNAGITGFTVDSPSTVIVEAASLDDYDWGDYTLIVEPYSLDFVKEYFNLDIADAGTINPDTTSSGEINAGQRLHYQLDLRANQLVDVVLSGQHVEGYEMDTVLRIYDESGTLLAENDDYNGVSSGIVEFSVPKNMTVTVEVATYGDSEAGTYDLSVQTNNLQIMNEGTISIGDTVTGNIKSGQRFRYTLNLEAGRSITIFLSRDESQSGLNIAELAAYIQGNANEWVSCLEYYGYVVDTAYVINQDGIGQFVYGSKLANLCDLNSSDCHWSAQIILTAFGKFLFYVILPGLAIVLPIITVFMLKGDWEILWFISLLLVAAYVLTSALLYVHLGTVSGIVALSEFAYGMFGGTATGSAIAFMTKVLENFSIDRSEDTSEQAKAILELIESQLRNAVEESHSDPTPKDAETDEEPQDE